MHKVVGSLQEKVFQLIERELRDRNKLEIHQDIT